MPIFKNEPIMPIQDWQGRRYTFDPDASPAAWEHYKHYYSETFNTYAVCSPTFFSYERERYRYIPKPNSEVNPQKACRLYALPKGIEPSRDEKEQEYYSAVIRLSGETDFNFNKWHYPALEKYLKNEPEYNDKLKQCRDQQHCLLNFSLMQSMGNMQKFKGRKCDDRLDRFVYYLGEFYENGADNKLEEYIQGERRISKENRMELKKFLNEFENLADYMEKIYFISDAEFIKKMRVHGKKELDTPENVKTFIDLAYTFWEKKDFYFSQKEYLTIGSYFPDGGEVYTYQELSDKLMNDLCIPNQKEIDAIIEKCLDKGFMYQCGNSCYTR